MTARGENPWATYGEFLMAAVTLATLMWVKWYNEQRINGYLDDISPAEYEGAYHAERSATQLVENQ